MNPELKTEKVRGRDATAINYPKRQNKALASSQDDKLIRIVSPCGDKYN